MKPLNTDMNAQRWAKEFVELHGGDEDLMRSWFANAIMCGWDNYYWSTDEYKQTIKHLEELQKCEKDPVYFINNYVKTVTIDKGLTDFKLYPYQEDLINKYHNNRFNICKSPRCAGKTSTGLFYLLHHIIFNDNVTDGIFSFNASDARNSLERLQTAYENLPEWMQHKVIINNKSTLELENGSMVIASNASYNTFKSLNFDLVYLDEFAFVSDKDAQDFFIKIFPMFTASKSTKVIIASSIKQRDDCFSKIWKDSEDGKNQFVRTLIKWDEIPGRNNKWKEQTSANIGIDAWNQEYECKFVDS
jgi:hypothetical protein